MIQSTATELLCCHVAKAKWSEHDLSYAQDLLGADSFSESHFWELVSFNGVDELAVKKLLRTGLNIPLPAREKSEKVQRTNLARRHDVLKLVEACNRAGVEIFILKGVMLGELVYEDPAYKRMNDVDILFRQHDVLRAVEVAEREGFRFAMAPLFGKSPIDFRLHHSPPLISNDKKTLIGLHWGITPDFAKRKPTTDLFEGCEDLPIEDACAKRLSHEHNILHLCIHLPFFKTGVRELADIGNLVNFAKPALCFDKLLKVAALWRCEDAVYRAITLADRLIGCLNEQEKNALEKVATRMRASPYVTDTNNRLGELGSLVRSRSTYVSKIEKNFVLFKLATRMQDRLYHLKEQWRLVLFVPKDERDRVLGDSKYFGRSRAAWRVCLAVMQGLGPTVFWIVTFKNLLSLFASSKRDPADFESAKKLLENIE